MPIKLFAPPHTPLRSNGDLNLEPVTQQARHFRETGLTGASVCGSTGEGQSLTVAERLQRANRWVDAGRDTGLQVIIQVGHNCQRDAIRLAAHAAEIGADAVATLAPCYFKPAPVEDLVDFCVPVADATQSLPFYIYELPLHLADLQRRGTPVRR